MSDNFIMSIYGKKGSGKSIFTGWFTNSFKRLIVFDTMNCFNEDNFDKVISNIKDFEKFINIVNSKYEKKDFRILLRYPPFNRKKYFELTNYVIYSYLKDIVYVIDEIQLFMSSHIIPEYFNALISSGRHKNISIITITQRPANIPNMLIANGDYIVVFETNLKKDLETLQSYKYCDVNIIKGLDDYEFYMIDLKNKKSYKSKIILDKY